MGSDASVSLLLIIDGGEFGVRWGGGTQRNRRMQFNDFETDREQQYQNSSVGVVKSLMKDNSIMHCGFDDDKKRRSFI